MVVKICVLAESEEGGQRGHQVMLADSRKWVSKSITEKGTLFADKSTFFRALGHIEPRKLG